MITAIVRIIIFTLKVRKAIIQIDWILFRKFQIIQLATLFAKSFVHSYCLKKRLITLAECTICLFLIIKVKIIVFN